MSVGSESVLIVVFESRITKLVALVADHLFSFAVLSRYLGEYRADIHPCELLISAPKKYL